MKRLFLLNSFLLSAIITIANTIVVKNIEELNAANKKAQPGDIIILQNGEWKDVTIKLNCTGTKEQPITFKAQVAGKVIVNGNSQLRLGGNFITVDGLYFLNGYSGDNPVINFCIDKNQLANNCRVTNTVVNDFNNPKRMDENYWVAFYGKNNRLDHCSFKDKKNLGVLLAVILDDDRSRENFHSIDHNYFGRRPPLASNGGEIIRVGVSQHCQFNSNTQITDNFFEHCDGETEIISIKSCSNVVRGNVFKESQGGVVLRHGNDNTVENNIFLGNNKEGTGGVRIINKGQWVVNNFFYQCRGVDFRSPLSVMNGIPNSPANRYVQVTDAVIMNNTYFNCTPVSFCEGSDAERSLAPDNVLLANNVFYNTTDSNIYKVFDDIKGFSFWGNEINTTIKQEVNNGFIKASFNIQKTDIATLPRTLTKGAVALPDSLQKVTQSRLQHTLSTKPGFADLALIKTLQTNAYTGTGAKWFNQVNKNNSNKPLLVNCKTAEDVYKQLEKSEPVIITMTGINYSLDKPFVISKVIQFAGNKNTRITFTTSTIQSVFVIAGNGNLTLNNLNINGENVKATHFISNDSSGSSNHYNLSIRNCTIQGFRKTNGCENIFYAYKNMVADSIVINNSSFSNNNSNGIMMAEEKDNKGYYNAEKIVITQNNFNFQVGTLLNVYRGGNDESTMGPLLFFTGNKIKDCNSEKEVNLLNIYGVQRTFIEKNTFANSNSSKVLLRFEDIVRAAHLFRNNIITGSGTIIPDKFVQSINNTIN